MKKITKILILFFTYTALLNSVFAKDIKFIHLTDINLNSNNAKNLSETIKEINEYKDIDFVIFGGNNISSADINKLNAFIKITKKLNKKAYFLLGSNDVSSSNGIDKELFLYKVNKTHFYHSKKPNYVFKKNGYVFVAMDGAKEYFKTSHGCYTSQELKWLDETLKKYKNENVIILQHFPLALTNSTWLQTARIEDYLEVLAKHNNVKIIVSGHYNINKEEKINGIYNIITESYDKNNAYKIIEINLEEDFIGTNLVK